MVGIMNQNGIIIRRGDTFDILIHFKNKHGGDLNLEGCTIKMAVKEPKESKPIFTVNAEIISEEEGKARIKLTSKHTRLPLKDYATDIQLTLKNGDIHTVYPQNINQVGVFRITEDVTEE